MITGLFLSEEEKFTAILVIVDKLTKFTFIIPTHNKLSQEGFAKFFIGKIVNIFSLPKQIIVDYDKKWATAFWKSVVSHYGGILAFSSSDYPQTDGQTSTLHSPT